MARESETKKGILERDREERRVRDTYGAALVLVLVSTLALVAAGSPVLSPLAAGAALLQVGALILTLRVSGFRPRMATVIGSGFVLLFVVMVAAFFAASDSARMPGTLLWLVLTVTTIVAIVKRLVTYRQVTVQLLMGLLVIYILIGFAFGLGYMLSNEFVAPALKPGVFGVSGAIYFSFISLATVGFGDLVPGTDVARSMVIAEALIGQLYLVSVVSLAVSRLGTRRRTEPVADETEEATSAADVAPESTIPADV